MLEKRKARFISSHTQMETLAIRIKDALLSPEIDSSCILASEKS
jgi:hypothetical protein